MLTFIGLMLLLVGAAEAQSITTAVVASVFGTLGVIIALAVIGFLIYYYCCKTSKPDPELGGFDNPLLTEPRSQGYGAVPQPEPDKDTHTLKQVVADGGTQHPSVNGKTHVPEIVETEHPQDGSDEIFTVLLDRKDPPTNGFNIMPDQDGDVIISDVRESGPAGNKLQRGDIIDSVTVFFDSMKYEDALSILSNAAPYKVAVTVSRKPKDVKNEPDPNARDGATNEQLGQVRDTEKVYIDKLKTEDGQGSIASSLSEDAVTDLNLQKEEQTTELEKPKPKDTSSDAGSYLEGIATPSQEMDSEKQPEEDTRVVEEDNVQEEVVEEVTALQSPNESMYPDLDTPVTTPAKKREEIVFTSGWRKVVKLLDLFKTGLVTEDTMKKLEYGEVEEKEVAQELRQYLKGEEPIAGLLLKNGDVMSLFDACKKGIIRRGTAVSLLEAQAATGSIINPQTGGKMTVSEATQENLIDRQFEALLIRAEKAVLGYKTKLSDEPLSLFEAMQRNLVVESHGIRLLEAQIATGGIIDPHANHRLPVDVAFERGLFDRRLHGVLEDPSDDTKGFFDPNTNENLTYMELMKRCTIAEDTGLRLLPFQQEEKAI